VRKEIEDRHGVRCVIVEADRLSGSGGLTWSNGHGATTTLPADDGSLVDVASLDVVWWRRASTRPEIPPSVTDEAHRELIVNDSQAALLGVLLNEFSGTWVSEPLATRRAENKLVQLRAAAACGLRTPRTLVSQDPDAIRRFCGSLGNRVVIKAVRGTHVRPPITALVDERLLDEDEAMALAPAIYQEYVPGREHIRAHVFGDQVHAAGLESDAVDWRPDMTTPVRPIRLPEALESRLRGVVRHLGLEMGVIDLKVGEDGEPVWLEVNAQGQFLFVEALAGLPLTAALADYLVSKATPRR
jgi:glutathione synthase/RimK-type ligase-like ATP-grasp enzyme